ncbi:MAG: hypothetical protein F4X26_01575 [Chloroflexi bacterium]|nr:hypothetical protein [Chloroflexota bacterium]
MKLVSRRRSATGSHTADSEGIGVRPAQAVEAAVDSVVRRFTIRFGVWFLAVISLQTAIIIAVMRLSAG